MKLTKQALKRIIREETKRTLKEAVGDDKQWRKHGGGPPAYHAAQARDAVGAEQGGSIIDKLQAALSEITADHTLDEDGDPMGESQRAPAAFIPIQEVADEAGIDVSELATFLLNPPEDMSWISLRVEVPRQGPHNL
jgi:hypothetical protein